LGPEHPELSIKMNFVMALIISRKAGSLVKIKGYARAGPKKQWRLSIAPSASRTFVHLDPNDPNVRGRLAMAGLSMAGILRHSDPRRSVDIYDHTLRHMAEIRDNSSSRRFEVSALAGSTYPLRRLGPNAFPSSENQCHPRSTPPPVLVSAWLATPA
jgi:hypothetical protein